MPEVGFRNFVPISVFSYSRRLPLPWKLTQYAMRGRANKRILLPGVSRRCFGQAVGAIHELPQPNARGGLLVIWTMLWCPAQKAQYAKES